MKKNTCLRAVKEAIRIANVVESKDKCAKRKCNFLFKFKRYAGE